MDYNIDSKTYEKLYAKYLHNDRTKEMVDLAGDLKGKRVLDLCCGGCRLTREVLKRDPEYVLASDKSYNMLKNINPIPKNCFLSIEKANIELKVIADHGIKLMDAIFCQQAINYWFKSEHAELVKGALTPKGVFIFNTFNNCPGKEPVSKSYSLNNKRYIEIFWLVGDRVKHVQIAQGMDPHFTEFRWIPPQEFKRAFMKAGFKVTLQTDGATDIYICRKG
jgi:SAM-dependent methyltransferase